MSEIHVPSGPVRLPVLEYTAAWTLLLPVTVILVRKRTRPTFLQSVHTELNLVLAWILWPDANETVRKNLENGTPQSQWFCKSWFCWHQAPTISLVPKAYRIGILKKWVRNAFQKSKK